MVENIDWNVGRLLQTLDDLNLVDNTMVVFFCDNGPNSYRFNGGMKGRKGSIDEGGLRSPLFIRWPGHIRAGAKFPQIAGAIDLLPTLTDLCGIQADTVKPIDGRSLRPILLDESTSWEPRVLLATKNNQVSVRTQQYRLDAAGQLFDIPNDPGQRVDVSAEHPQLTTRLKKLQSEHAAEMKQDYERFADRPFTVGYAKSTTLPARDGVEHGTIRRSAKPPNNSFFTHWTSLDDAITWEIDVVTAGQYEVILYYTCAAGNEGTIIRLTMEDAPIPTTTTGTVVDIYDPPLYDKSKERVQDSHYFVKDFKPVSLGRLSLPVAKGRLRLTADTMPGTQVVDVHSIELVRR